MVKKFLLSAAVIGALATSAMAYNQSELSQMVAAGTENTTSDISKVGFDQTQLANTLVFPAYFVGNGWETTVRVINPTNHGVIAKVVLYDGKDSHEVRDFNIYLSANDVWVGKIKVDSDGVAKIISTDDSTPLENGGVASEDNPFEKSISSNTGYIEVIEMATVQETAHGDHETLRKAYKEFALAQRKAVANPDIVFDNGVIKNKQVTLPYVKLKDNNGIAFDTAGSTNNYTVTIDTTTYTFEAAKADLTGDIRITDTVNGKDMDMMAYKLNYTTDSNSNGIGELSLIYLEGEKANVADVEINTGLVYDSGSLDNDIKAISSTQAYITYGDAPANNMYALITNPFKRLYVQSYLAGTTSTKMPAGANFYKDAETDADGNINYGSTSLVAQIFDESENMMSAGQFSPATTPTIKLTNEVASTGYDVNDPNTLAYYLNQAAGKGYKRGYVKLTNADGSNIEIPGIMTQMLATTAGDRVVTNWIIPQQ